MGRGALTIEAVNERLYGARVGVSVEQKGNRLYLRATLPAKPGSKKTKPHQQYIALQIYANAAGLVRAEAEARKVGALLACKEFDWAPYLRQKTQDSYSCGNWIERYKKYYFGTKLQVDDPEKAELLWLRRCYSPVLSKLPVDEPLTASAMIAAVQHTKPNTRARQIACQVLQRFAKFAEVEVDLQPYIGNYSPKKVLREIPSDEEIVAGIDRFTSPAWRYLYGLMATYGLRNHEVYHTELEWRESAKGEKFLVARIKDGKTGARDVYPFYPEWVERWQLESMHLPKLTARINQDYGERISRAFKRANMPFTPYDLRHAYAIRISVVFKLPVAVAAAYMGHSPTVHWQTYNRWISQEQHQRAYEEMLLNQNRPLSPT